MKVPLQDDLGEQTDVAQKHPEIVAKARELFKTAHTDYPDDGTAANSKKKEKKAKKKNLAK
jgi:hypothetical protein